MAKTNIIERLNIVFDEYQDGKPHGRGLRPFAAVLGTSHSVLARVLSGVQEPGQKLINSVVYTLGYSPEWVINGTGQKKAKLSDPKTITEIALLKKERHTMQLTIDKLAARLKGVEDEVDELRSMITKNPVHHQA